MPTDTGQQAQQTIDQANKSITDFNTNLGGTISLLGNIDDTSKQKFGNFQGYLNKTGIELGNLKLGFTQLAQSISLGTNEFTKLSNAFFALSKFSQTADFFSSFKGSQTVFSTVNENISAMGSNWQGVLERMKARLPDALKDISDNLIKNVSKGQQAEMQFVSLMATSGKLGSVFNEQGQIIGNLSSRTLEYTNSLSNVAKANGLTLRQTLEYSNALDRLPNMMDQLVSLTDANSKAQGSGANQTSILTAALKLASGSGQEFSKVTATLSTAYNELSNAQGRVANSGEKGLQLFATMSEVSKTLNIQFSQAEGFLNKVANQFKFMGDNTEGATKVLGRFMNALRDTGLTSQASLDVIQGMVDAVGKLTIGTRAFISARSGGPGGLQGAFQIEQLIRQGRIDQVVQMTEKTLRQQLGGKIYSLQEAAQNPQAAAQFMRQRSLVQSGAFGNLVGNGPDAEAKATRLLEALAKGDRGGAADAIKTGQDALHQVATQGTSLQEQTNTILNDVAVSSEQTAIATQLTAAAWAKSNFGGGDFQKGMQKAADAAGMVAIQNQNQRAFNQTGESKQSSDALRAGTLDTAVESIKAGTTKLVSGLTKGLGEDASSLMGGGEVIASEMQLMSDIRNTKRIDRETVKLPPPQRGVQANQLTRGARQSIPTTTALNTANAVQNQNINVKTQINVALTDDAKKLITVNQTTDTNNTSSTERRNAGSLFNEPTD